MALNNECVDNPIEIKDYSWIDDDGKIDEIAFCKAYVSSHPVKCVNDIFYGMDGVVSVGKMRAEIYKLISGIQTKGVAKKVDNLIETLKLETYKKELPVELDRIHVENGIYYIYYSGIGYPKGPNSSQGVGLTYGPSVKNIHGYDA